MVGSVIYDGRYNAATSYTTSTNAGGGAAAFHSSFYPKKAKKEKGVTKLVSTFTHETHESAIKLTEENKITPSTQALVILSYQVDSARFIHSGEI